MKAVATISFDEGSPYKRYEMSIFPKTKITIKRVARGASVTLFEGDIKDLMDILWRDKNEMNLTDGWGFGDTLSYKSVKGRHGIDEK